jgi:hypothetical protein
MREPPLPLGSCLEGDEFDLEGQDLLAVDLGHTDTDDTTCPNRVNPGALWSSARAVKP